MADRYFQREQLLVRGVLLCCAIVLAHFIHVGWLTFVPAPAEKTILEPNFRVGMPFLFSMLEHIAHPRDGALFITLTDFTSALLAFNILYAITASGLSLPAEKSPARPLVVCLFLVFLQFPIAYVVPWQRPETLPSTLFLAFSLFCLQRSSRSPLWTVALIAGAILQTFVRADVAIVLSGSLLLLSFFGTTLAEFGSRTSNAVRGLFILALSSSFQFYMQFVKYRNVPYQKGSPILDNFSPHMLALFFSATLIFVFTIYLFFRQPRRLTAAESLIVAASVLYLPFYFVLGIIGEVRIYVPFLCCLCVVAARVSASYLLERDVMKQPAITY